MSITSTMTAKEIQVAGLHFCAASFAEKNADVRAIIGWRVSRMSTWGDYAKARKDARQSRLGTLRQV